MSYRDISSHIEEIYQVSISTATISTVTDKIIAKVKEWQTRSLEPSYPFTWLDAIYYKIKDGSKYVSKAVYTILIWLHLLEQQIRLIHKLLLIFLIIFLSKLQKLQSAYWIMPLYIPVKNLKQKLMNGKNRNYMYSTFLPTHLNSILLRCFGEK